MRRLFASDLGIWPMLLNQQVPAELMFHSTDYWTRIADYILMYDQIVIPTGNLQIMALLRLILGDDIFKELVASKVIVLARFDQWFGYVGHAGIGCIKFGPDPNGRSDSPNISQLHYQPLDEAIDSAFIAYNPPTTVQQRSELKNLLFDNIVQLPIESLVNDARDEAYRDIENSPYLRELMAIRNIGRPINRLVGSKPDLVTVYSPHNAPEPGDVPEIRALLQVTFENLLLRLSSFSSATELTGDAASLSVLNAKGQRLGYAPHGRESFAKLQDFSGVPALGTAFAKKQLSARQIIDLRSSVHAQKFRDWLAIGNPSDTADEVVKRYADTIGQPKLIDTLPAKLLRFATTTGWGIIEPLTGTLAATVDSFLLSKWFPERGPRLFMQQAKLVIANSPTIQSPNKKTLAVKGRDRNSLCSCGSGKKYKRCCG